MSGIKDSQSEEARALSEVRPDLLRVVQSLRMRDAQRQAIESWGRHSEETDSEERARLVAIDLDISDSTTQQLLANMGVIQRPPGYERQRALEMFQEGASVDHVREELTVMQDVALEMAITDYALQLAKKARRLRRAG